MACSACVHKGGYWLWAVVGCCKIKGAPRNQEGHFRAWHVGRRVPVGTRAVLQHEVPCAAHTAATALLLWGDLAGCLRCKSVMKWTLCASLSGPIACMLSRPIFWMPLSSPQPRGPAAYSREEVATNQVSWTGNCARRGQGPVNIGTCMFSNR
jgi:hypothetical protein